MQAVRICVGAHPFQLLIVHIFERSAAVHPGGSLTGLFLWVIYSMMPFYSIEVRMVSAKYLALWLLLVTFLLNGCAHLGSPGLKPRKIAWHQRKRQLLKDSDWHIQGVIGIKTRHHTESANFAWVQQGQSYQVALSGPLGLGAVAIEGGPQGIVFTDHKGHQTRAKTPEALLQKTFGWQLPITDLSYWIKGVMKPGQVYDAVFDPWGRVKHLEQAGWQMDYLRYLTTQSADRPLALRLVRGNLHVKIVVNHWFINR